MYISVDAGCLGITDERLKVGVYQVVKNLLIQLGKIDKTNTYLLYSFYPIDKKLLNEFGNNVKNVVLPSIGWLQLVLPTRLSLDKPDIFIAANQAIPFQLPGTKYKTIGIFYDIAFEKYPELYSYAASVKKHRENSKKLAQKSDMIISISRNTKIDVQKFYNVPENKIIVAYPGINNELEIQKGKLKSGIKKPYFLFVGAFKKSKNIPNLLQAFDTFLQKTKKDYQLLLVGGDKWLDPEIEKTFQLLNDKTQRNTKILGFVSDEKLTTLYKNAVALVSPSFYEGFGLSFLEAQSFGCPVIGSKRGSLPEVIGDSGLLVEPVNTKKIASAMQKLAEDNEMRRYLIEKGYENVKKYSWKAFAKTVQSAIGRLA